MISLDLASARWRKSSHSGDTGGRCGPKPVFEAAEWRTFIAGIKQR
jgi:hypothetical protein